MKKYINKFIVAIVFFAVILSIPVFATEQSQNRYYQPNRQYYDPKSTATDPELLEEMKPLILPDRSNPIIAVSRKILSILQLLGVAIGLIMLVLIGIKFIVAKDKPDIKETAKNYIFGAFCIFGATGILSVIQQLVNEFNSLI